MNDLMRLIEDYADWHARHAADHGVQSDLDEPNYSATPEIPAVRAQIKSALDRLKADLLLAEHKVIACGVAARHPDASLASTGPYANEWDSPQLEEVRKLRADRDRLAAAAQGTPA